MAASVPQVKGQSPKYNLKAQDVKMMFSQQMRWPISYRLVSQSCRWCGLQANTRKATLKPNYLLLLFFKHSIGFVQAMVQ